MSLSNIIVNALSKSYKVSPVDILADVAAGTIVFDLRQAGYEIDESKELELINDLAEETFRVVQDAANNPTALSTALKKVLANYGLQ